VNDENIIGGGRGGRGRGGNRGGGGGRGARGDLKHFGFLILDEYTTITMKNISPSILPNFHGVRHGDPKTFLFEFEVLCRSYDYLLDSQKLKLFVANLKYIALKWFMGLGKHTIKTWEEMKNEFLEKYKDYCMQLTLKMKSLK